LSLLGAIYEILTIKGVKKDKSIVKKIKDDSWEVVLEVKRSKKIIKAKNWKSKTDSWEIKKDNL
jgi:hypothetical protein